MKKTLILLYTCLVLAAAAGLWFNRGGTYLAERSLWKLSREYDAIVNNTTGTPTQNYVLLLEKLDKFIRRYSPNRVVSVGYILRGRLLTVQGKYALAKQEFDEALDMFAGQEALVVQLLLEEAQMYALAGDHQGVADTYGRIIKEHALTPHGMQGPLILAKYFVQKREAARAKEAYIAAIDHYRGLITKYPESQVEFQSRLLLAESFKFLEDWDKVLELHKETLLRFAAPEFWNRQSLLYVIQSINSATILRNKDFTTPVTIYSEFIQKYPGHPFNDDLAEYIRRIQYMEARTRETGAPVDASALDNTPVP
ncbi:MAG: hypothetical protein KC897_08525 [Candidatus Omnitrophica bacterium]|nr:hypothetical protein [Candidatus Omnitrophota bacterium]MCB9719768.1 hypothetical protein [Candidatus Omnitrophota bacterium]